MRFDSRRRCGGRPWFGIVVIIVGVLALLGNMDVINLRELQPYWPLAFVVVGVMKLFQRRWAMSPVIGLVLIGLGSAMTAQNLGVIRLSLHDWWPAFVILGGVMMVARSFYPHPFHAEHRRFRGGFRQSQIDHGDVVNIKSAFSGTALKNDSQDFKGGNIELALAGLELDLRHASIVGEAELRISAMMSGVNIRVPTDWQVIVQGVPTMGGVEDRSVPPMNPSKRLVIHAEIVMGGLEIKN